MNRREFLKLWTAAPAVVWFPSLLKAELFEEPEVPEEPEYKFIIYQLAPIKGNTKYSVDCLHDGVIARHWATFRGMNPAEEDKKVQIYRAMRRCYRDHLYRVHGDRWRFLEKPLDELNLEIRET